MNSTYRKMVPRLWTALTLVTLALTIARADSSPSNPSALTRNPWEKLSVSLGAFYSDTNSNVRVGSGLGVDIDLEKAMGLETKSTIFRVESAWRFTSNRRHRLDASWFGLRRNATRTIGQDIEIKDRNGNPLTISAGTTVESKFNLDIIETAYSFSFLQDDRVDLAAIGGVYVMPIKFGLKATGLVEGDGDLSITAPLPVVGFRMDVLLTPKWYLRSGSQIFDLNLGNFSGQLIQTRAAVEFLPLEHFGMGLGVDSMRILVEAENKDNTNIKGKVQFQYVGLQLYAKMFF